MDFQEMMMLPIPILLTLGIMASKLLLPVPKEGSSKAKPPKPLDAGSGRRKPADTTNP